MCRVETYVAAVVVVVVVEVIMVIDVCVFLIIVGTDNMLLLGIKTAAHERNHNTTILSIGNA